MSLIKNLVGKDLPPKNKNTSHMFISIKKVFPSWEEGNIFYPLKSQKKKNSKTKDKFWGMKKKIICGEGENRGFKN